MIRVQRVDPDGLEPTWTVLGHDHLPLPEVERFLEWWEFLVLRDGTLERWRSTI